MKIPEQPAVYREQIFFKFFFFKAKMVIFTSLFHADILRYVPFNKGPVCL